MSHLRARCQDIYIFSRFSVGGVCNALTVNPTTLKVEAQKTPDFGWWRRGFASVLGHKDLPTAVRGFWHRYVPLPGTTSCLNRGPFSCGIVRGRAFACRCRAKCHLQSVAGRARSIHTSRNRRSGATRQEFRANDAPDWDLQYLPLSAPGPE